MRYEIKNINPPGDILGAMEKQMRAEREKRAVVLASEGERDAKINEAEGEKQRVIKESEAVKQQQINEAEGQAAAILARRASDEERVQFELDYEERLLNPYVAAERGFVDSVVDPAETRREVAAALSMLANKRERLPHRKHGNTPL